VGENMALEILYSFGVLVLAIIAVYIVFRIGKMLIGLLTNIVLGFVSLFVINLLFGMNIPYNIAAIILTAIFGVVGVFILLLLKFIGISV
jgi:inhibitor of the pro-sigma K processing machinery